MKSFFSQLNSALVSYSCDPERAEFLQEVKNYIQEGSPLSYKNKMLYLPLWDETSTEVAKILGVSAGAVRGARNLMSRELYMAFGQNFFDVVNTNLKAAKNRFHVVKNYKGKETLFIPGFMQLLPPRDENVDINGVRIKDCMREIEFLEKYTKKAVRDGLKGVSRKKPDKGGDETELSDKKIWFVLGSMDVSTGLVGEDTYFSLIYHFLK